MDSTGKIPSGLIEGVSSMFGEYDQCLDIESNPTENYSQIIRGKYCLATPDIKFPSFEELKRNFSIKFLTNKTNHLLNEILRQKINTIKLLMANNNYLSKFTLFRFGLCIPSNCEAKHIERAINRGQYWLKIKKLNIW
jgi:hypothetical protein